MTKKIKKETHQESWLEDMFKHSDEEIAYGGCPC